MDLFLSNVRAALGPHGEGYESTIEAILALRAKVESTPEASGADVLQQHLVTKFRDGHTKVVDVTNPAPPTSEECAHKYGSAIRHVCVRCGFDALAQPTPADESGASEDAARLDWLSDMENAAEIGVYGVTTTPSRTLRDRIDAARRARGESNE